jgi:predicted secreted protein
MACADYANPGEKIKVGEGKTFEISLSEAINPFAVWKCAKYDEQFIEFLGEEYKVPPEGLVGATTHIFKFKALRAGKTDIVFETEDKKESKLYEIHIQEGRPRYNISIKICSPKLCST